MAGKRGNKLANIEATIHKKDRRANIPTEELRDFVAEDEAKPKTILYPRDSGHKLTRVILFDWEDEE